MFLSYTTDVLIVISLFCKAPQPFGSFELHSARNVHHRKSDGLDLIAQSSKPVEILRTTLKQSSLDETSATRTEIELMTKTPQYRGNLIRRPKETDISAGVTSCIPTRALSLRTIAPVASIPKAVSPLRGKMEFDVEFRTADDSGPYPIVQPPTSAQHTQPASSTLIGWINQLPIELPESFTESIDRTGPDDAHEQ